MNLEEDCNVFNSLNPKVILPKPEGMDFVGPLQQKRCPNSVKQIHILGPRSLSAERIWKISEVVQHLVEKMTFWFSFQGGRQASLCSEE